MNKKFIEHRNTANDVHDLATKLLDEFHLDRDYISFKENLFTLRNMVDGCLNDLGYAIEDRDE